MISGDGLRDARTDLKHMQDWQACAHVTHVGEGGNRTCPCQWGEKKKNWCQGHLFFDTNFLNSSSLSESCTHNRKHSMLKVKCTCPKIIQICIHLIVKSQCQIIVLSLWVINSESYPSCCMYVLCLFLWKYDDDVSVPPRRQYGGLTYYLMLLYLYLP